MNPMKAFMLITDHLILKLHTNCKKCDSDIFSYKNNVNENISKWAAKARSQDKLKNLNIIYKSMIKIKKGKVIKI